MSVQNPFHIRSVADDDFPRRLGISAAVALALNFVLWTSIAFK